MSFVPPADEVEAFFDGQSAYLLDEHGIGEFEDSELVDPYIPTEAKPGSEDKVQMLAARYAAGLPLWHDSDCYDHGPDRQDGEDEEEEFDLLEELSEDLA